MKLKLQIKVWPEIVSELLPCKTSPHIKTTYGFLSLGFFFHTSVFFQSKFIFYYQWPLLRPSNLQTCVSYTFCGCVPFLRRLRRSLKFYRMCCLPVYTREEQMSKINYVVIPFFSVHSNTRDFFPTLTSL